MIRYIANSKYSKVVSGLLAFVIFFNNLIFPTRAIALTGGPSQPEFTGFVPAGSSEMVNLFTGDFSYNIPLMDVDGYPVNIAYQASPSMEQEASWVGLGWTLNAGAVNRGMRGLPDDFNGDPVHRDLKIEPYRAWGVTSSYFGELAGYKLPLNISGGLGVVHSNYKGWGVEFATNNSISSSNQMQMGLTAGLGTKISSQDGVDIYPQLGIHAQMQSNGKSASVGVNVGCAINSREGLKNVYGGFSLSASAVKKVESAGTTKGGKSLYKNNGVGFGVGSSASIPASSQGFMPTAIASMKSGAFNFDGKMGLDNCIYAQGFNMNGYYVQSGIEDSEKHRDYNAYGYFYAENAGDADMLDFNREKDGMVYPETPNMPVSNFTYDMFSANAQGMMYAFRPQRNDIGILHDNSTLNSSFGIGLGPELMFTTDFNVGINVNVNFANGHAGRWTNDNDFNLASDFKKGGFISSSVDNYEPAYFKVAGEKTDDDATFLGQITNNVDDAYRVRLAKVTNQRFKSENVLVDKHSTSSTLASSPSAKTKRATRNELVSYLNALQASQYAISKKIENYPLLTSPVFTPSNFDNHILQSGTTGSDGPGEFVHSNVSQIDRDGTFNASRGHHLSEMTVTQSNGARYVYGIPLYNRQQTDAVFNIGQGTINNQNVTDGIINYSSSDDEVQTSGNSKGIDHFCEKRTIPDYSHGFLLTSVLSTDYVDRTGNGPSIDDYGDYTKFNYTRTAGEESAYKWRMPMSTGNSPSANFNQGLLADDQDNKGTYVYGKKDLWYLQSIETKNYVAFFILNDNNNSSERRLDAYEPDSDEGGIASSAKAHYLKEIRLYAKKDFIHGGIANATPIKIVNFEYDYSLCPQTPNSTATGGGKLTLKKIYFTYGNSQKGKLSPYVFNYADIDHDGTVDMNPPYKHADVDRWGYYQPNVAGSLNNLDFPYTRQGDANADQNKNAAAWSLTQIKTPAGSTINIDYEADDYAFVQATCAGQMFQVAGIGTTASPSGISSSGSSNLYGADYIYLDLSASKDQGIPQGASGVNALFTSKYVKNLDKIYYRFKVNMDGKGHSEFVPGYADIDSYGLITGVSGGDYYTYAGQNYYKYAYIKVKEVGMNDKDQGTAISPIVKAAFQMGRMYLPQIMFPGSQPNSGNGTALVGLMTTMKDARHMLKGINKALYDRKMAYTCEPGSSIVRLYNPGGRKVGGGSRVSKITISDGWHGMSGENESTYGQEYTYTTTDNSQTISSGVASYEPLLGGDEISMRYPIDFKISHKFAPNDEYFQEEPMGESFFPDPVVGYSKVSVKNLGHKDNTGANIVSVHGTGHSEYEFYTAKDFPVVTDRTDLQKERVKPKLLMSILKFGSTDKLYMSQGYVIKTNDMHGKPKSQKMFAENETKPLSGITYHYKTRNGLKSVELDNTVDVIDKTNTIASKTIGKVTDFYSDSREAINDVYNAGIGININNASCSEYIPLVFIWPSFAHDHREYHSMGTTKLIQQYGLIDYVEAFENNSNVTTKNLLYDDLTGEVLLTQTINDFDQPVYNFKYPAYWGYSRMGGAFENTGIKVKASVVASSGQIDNLYSYLFKPGDEVAIIDPYNPNYGQKGWIIEDKATSTGLYLVDSGGHVIDGSTIPHTTSSLPSYLQILRSGNRNLQSLPMASMLSLVSPIVSNKINVTNNTKVLNSSAVEYSDQWNLLCGDKKGDASCDCQLTQDGTNLISALQAVFDNNWNIQTSVQVYHKQGNFTGTFADNNLSPLLQSFSWFNGCDAYNPSVVSTASRDIYLTVSKSVSGSNHYMTLQFTGSGPYCSGTSCAITFTATGQISSSPNFWDQVHGVRGITVRNASACAGSYTLDLSDYGTNGTAARPDDIDVMPPSVTLSASSCYQLTNCTANNTVVQCGKVVGDVINPYFENIRGNWRVKKSYSYLTDRYQVNQSNPSMNGDIRSDGYFPTFKPFWQYTTSANSWQAVYNSQRVDYSSSSPYDKWIKNNEVEKINPYGNVLQASDVLGRHSASLYGYNHTLPVAAANNSYYNQLAFDGFEDYDYILNECTQSLSGTTAGTNSSGYMEHFSYYPYLANRVSTLAHTGRYSMQVQPLSTLSVTRKLTNPACASSADDAEYTIKECDCVGLFGPFYNFAQPQKFVLSVWAKENVLINVFSTTPVLQYPHTSANVSVNGTLLTTTAPKVSAIVNGWQKLDYEFTVPAYTASGKIVVSLLNSGSNTMYYDDIRIHPFNASMKSMVYDPTSLRLMAELDDRNFATFYEYDEEGTLVRIKKETEKGIYTIKESRSGIIKQ